MIEIKEIHISEWSVGIYIIYACNLHGYEIGKFAKDGSITNISLRSKQNENSILIFNSRRNAVRYIKRLYSLSNRAKCCATCIKYKVI